MTEILLRRAVNLSPLNLIPDGLGRFLDCAVAVPTISHYR